MSDRPSALLQASQISGAPLVNYANVGRAKNKYNHVLFMLCVGI